MISQDPNRQLSDTELDAISAGDQVLENFVDFWKGFGAIVAGPVIAAGSEVNKATSGGKSPGAKEWWDGVFAGK
jgi:hypothetical protein